MDLATPDQFTNDVIASLERHLSFAHLSCDHLLQMEQANRVADIFDGVEDYRREAISMLDESRANRAVALSGFVIGTQCFLRMWILLKQKLFEEAWDALVDAQSEVTFGLKFIDSEPMTILQKRLLDAEQILFPPQHFVSGGWKFISPTCSICKGRYGECGHVMGRLYMGRICVRDVEVITELDHLASVDYPRDKGCRTLETAEGRNVICTLTRRLIRTIPGDEEIRIRIAGLRVADRQLIFRFLLNKKDKLKDV